MDPWLVNVSHSADIRGCFYPIFLSTWVGIQGILFSLALSLCYFKDHAQFTQGFELVPSRNVRFVFRTKKWKEPCLSIMWESGLMPVNYNNVGITPRLVTMYYYQHLVLTTTSTYLWIPRMKLVTMNVAAHQLRFFLLG